ncbi:hypothetical protein R6Q59_004269 [Mikania micrantha]
MGSFGCTWGEFWAFHGFSCIIFGPHIMVSVLGHMYGGGMLGSRPIVALYKYCTCMCRPFGLVIFDSLSGSVGIVLSGAWSSCMNNQERPFGLVIFDSLCE